MIDDMSFGYTHMMVFLIVFIGRKRVPRTVKYIPPSLAPHPEHLGMNGDTTALQQDEGE